MGVAVVVLLVVLAVIAAGVWLAVRNRRSADEADKQFLAAELSVVAEDVVNLEPLVNQHPEARADYDSGVGRYRAAQAAIEYADEHTDRDKVARMVAEATYSMNRARAIVEGRDPPAPPPELLTPVAAPGGAGRVDRGGRPVIVLGGGRRRGGMGGWRPGRAARRAQRRWGRNRW
jgi:hypothetical protein